MKLLLDTHTFLWLVEGSASGSATMPDEHPASEYCDACGRQAHLSRYFLRHLNSGNINWEEFTENLPSPLVQMCERCMRTHVKTLPTDLAVKLLSHFRPLWEAVDFMIDPRGFVMRSATEEEIERKKGELR